jgi:ABC-type antimicrobial peptide transport system permease subunit
MTWRQLAFKNILHNARRYFGYISSSAMAVALYFMFACFTLNQDVEQAYMARYAKAVMGGCEYVIVVFAIFFILFFHAALIRARGKEFGLFRVIGMAPHQTWRNVFLESVILGAFAITAGLAIGTLFLKLFLMAMGSVLELTTPIRFAVPAAALVRTLLVFGIVLLLDAIVIATRTARQTPKSLLLSARTRQRSARASWWLVVLGLAALGLAYYLADAHSLQLTVFFFPILLLTAIGTYLFFSQVSVFILTKWKQKPQSGILMLILGRFAHRIRDHARVLTVVTMLSAMVLTSMGSVFGLQSIIGQNAVRINPFAVQLVRPHHHLLELGEADVISAFSRAGLPVSETVRVPVVVAGVQWKARGNVRQTQVTVISASNFERVRKTIWRTEPGLRKYLDTPTPPTDGHAVFYAPYPLMSPNLFSTKAIRINEVPSMHLTLNGQYWQRIFNEPEGDSIPDYVLEVSDQDFHYLTGHISGALKYDVNGFAIPNWRHTTGVVKQLKAALPASEHKWMTDRATTDTQSRQLFGVMTVAGFLVSVLFFLASGSAIYFRLQTQVEADRREFQSLRRIGIQFGEMKRVVTVELLLLFFAPVVVGVVHSVFAMVDFSHLVTLQGTAWPVFGMVVGAYIAFTGAYFLVVRKRYMRQIMA